VNLFCQRLALLLTLVTSLTANADVLDQPVSLRTEIDLIEAVVATLQHAVATSEQYRGSEPRLQRFASREISARRKPIEQLSKLSRIPPQPVQQLAIVPRDERSYLQAMLRNHARLIELFEYSGGLALSPETRRVMDGLSRNAVTEFAQLERLARR
jgi:hypothetical protein